MAKLEEWMHKDVCNHVVRHCEYCGWCLAQVDMWECLNINYYDGTS